VTVEQIVGAVLYKELEGKGFWIFLIRWCWLLTYLDMLLFVAIGLATIVFDSMPRIGK